LGAPAIGLEREQAVDLQKRTEEGRVPRSISEGSMNGGRTCQCQVRSVLTRGDLKNGKHVQIRRTTLTPSSGLRGKGIPGLRRALRRDGAEDGGDPEDGKWGKQ